ncbi:MAG: anion permease, partial [Planctomycetales bacterium]|nr:anion permease [Planctomycetales bacterium]
VVGVQPTFTEWMRWAMPIVLVMTPLAAFWLTRGLPRRSSIELPPTGPWHPAEVRTLLVFAVTAALWVTRREPFDGWSGLLNLKGANDASVALLAVVAMFMIPNGRGEKLLDWETAVRIPWGILILFSSGIVIAHAFNASGLSDRIGHSLTGLSQLPPLALIALVALAVTFLTEVTSNTATANLLMPILAATASAVDVDPRSLMVPAAISASFAFMLPVATGPNAIMFSSNQLTVREMAREGLTLNLLGAVVVTLVCYWQFG